MSDGNNYPPHTNIVSLRKI